jgi:hypothetical protein
MLTVWGRKTSSNVQALMWCIGELGLAYGATMPVTAMEAPTPRRSWP